MEYESRAIFRELKGQQKKPCVDTTQGFSLNQVITTMLTEREWSIPQSTHHKSTLLLRDISIP